MRVVIAPDSFSGTMSAAQAATAIADAWRAVRPADDVRLTPMSDGGLGLLEVVELARPDAEVHTVEVADARGVATQARWVVLPDGTAVVETAQAVGLHDLEPEQRNPLHATSYGVGQLLTAVADAGPGRMVVGLGGSATVDGGAGMASALTGHALRRADGNGVRVGGRWVREVAAVRGFTSREWPEVVIASDVTNPLLGPDGAATVFGPQKGADADAVAELEAALGVLADVVERDMPGGPWRDRPGAGAAGGLGFALMAFLGGRMDSGARIVAELVDLRLDEADLVITGEGSFDHQTVGGKCPGVVAGQARAAGARVAVVAGKVDPAVVGPDDEWVALGPEGLTDPFGRVRTAVAELAGRY